MDWLKKHIYKTLYLVILAVVVMLAAAVPPLTPSSPSPEIAGHTRPPSPSQEPAVAEIAVDPLPPSAQTGESLVVLSDQANINQFLSQNNLMPDDLTARQLDNTYLVARNIDDLNTAGVKAFPNLKYKTTLIPNDAQYSQQWHLPKIAAPAAWDITTGSSSAVIAVIDTGFALNHEDLSSKFTASGTWRDFVCDDDVPQAGDSDCDSDPNGDGVNHGTLTGGAAAAAANNSVGVASVDWEAKILPLQALDDNGSGTTAEVAEAVEYATGQGVEVISMSLGSTGVDDLLRQEIDEALAAGITVVAAIGNCGDSNYLDQGCDFQGQQLDPAKYGPVIGVGASTSTDSRASFSSYGSGVDLVAPGVSIRSTNWTSGNQTSAYTAASGTSLATPIVAGGAALIAGLSPGQSPADITGLLTDYADKVAGMGSQSFTNEYGHGRLNIFKSLQAVNITHPDGSVVKDPNGNSIYVIEDDTKRPVPSMPVLKSQYSQFGIAYNTATLADLELANGTAINFREGTLLKNNGSATIYMVDDTGSAIAKRPISSWSVFKGLGYSSSKIITASESQLPSTTGPAVNGTSLHPDGNLVKDPGSSSIYLIEDNLKRPISSAHIYLSQYGSFSGTYVIATSGDIALADSTDVEYREGALLKGSGSATIYVIDDTGSGIEKRPISSWGVFQLLGYSTSQVLAVPGSALPAVDGQLIN